MNCRRALSLLEFPAVQMLIFNFQEGFSAIVARL